MKRRSMYVKHTALLMAVVLFALTFTQVGFAEAVPAWGYTLERFNCDINFTKEVDSVEVADQLMQGKLTVENHFEAVDYDPENIDWDMQVSISPASFQLYLQALHPVAYLCTAYLKTENVAYLDFAYDFIASWNQYRQQESSASNRMVWYDHGTALRTDNLIYYILTCDTREGYLVGEKAAMLSNLILEHAAWLADDAHYTANHNHGIFQDQALLYAAYLIADENSAAWIAHAEERLMQQEKYAFSSEMIHVENSPSYQLGVLDLFWTAAEFVIDDEFAEKLKNDVYRAAEFMAYTCLPNGIVAQIGDTFSDPDISKTVSRGGENYGNAHYAYARSLGKLGEKPEANSVIYPVSGYYISHNNWDTEAYTQSTWMMFKSGYSSHTHKHADDNSFMLYAKGREIFVDGGSYNYVTGDFFRDYFVSSSAHNTVVVDGKTYSTMPASSTKTGIYTYQLTDDYDYVLGFNEEYTGVSFDRHFFNMGDAIILYDNLVSDESHVYSQLLHASEAMTLVSVTDSETVFLLDNGSEQYTVRVKQLLGGGTNAVVRGDDENAEYGWISRTQNQISVIDTLKCEKTGGNVDFITLITIEDENGNIDGIDSIAFNEDARTFHVVKSDGTEYDLALADRQRVAADDAVILEAIEDTFTFGHQKQAGNASYAWYVIDKNTGKAIEKTGFQTEPTFTYTFEQESDYLIRAYAKDGRYRCSADVFEIQWNEEERKWDAFGQEDKALNLKYLGHTMEKTEEDGSIYVCTISFEYDWSYRIRWYVYKNGAYYANYTVRNNNSMEFSFTEPGKYTVMYYLETSDGDNLFYNFPMVEMASL